MKAPSASLKDGDDEQTSAVLRETSVMDGVGTVISVRAAKAQLSALLEWVAGGHEITITSGGKPKAHLLPIGHANPRKVFTGTLSHLKKIPMQTSGPWAEDIVRADRDGRGW